MAVVRCPKCGKHYNDQFRWTICPHRPLSEPSKEADNAPAEAGCTVDVPVYRLDDVNWKRKEIPTHAGTIVVEGMTVRSLRKILEECDPDDLVTYMAEVTQEFRNAQVFYGVIGGVGIGANGVTCLVGPEVAQALKRANGGQ